MGWVKGSGGSQGSRGEKVTGSLEVTAVCRIHKLVIDDVRPEDEGDYTFIPDGYALSLSAKLNFLGRGQ